MEEIVTVNYFLTYLKNLSDNGYGDMKIKCKDGFLHKNEISANYMKGELELRGFIFNVDVVKSVKIFCSDIEKAKEKFYESLQEKR